MFIGITGTLFSGISDIATYLTTQRDFKLLALETGYYELSRDFKSLKLIDTPDTQTNQLKVHKTFQDNESLVNYATANWLDNFIIVSLKDMKLLELLIKRPFFCLISIDSSIATRFQRSGSGNLEAFLQQSEILKFANDGELFKIMDKAQLKIINETKNSNEFVEKLQNLNIIDNERLRPKWDSYFMSLADLAALRSNCMKRRVGCVLVRKNRIIATGYNGTPRNTRNCNEGGCPRCNNSGENTSGVGLSTCLCLHAEENALLEAGRDRIGSDAILYCNTCPCLTCTIKIVQTGIKEVVYSQSYSMDEYSSKVFKEAGVVLRQFIPPKYGVVMVQ